MSRGGVDSQFQFLSYKIDKIQMKMANKIEILMNNDPITPENINLAVRIRDPGKYTINNDIHYLGGIDVKIDIISSGTIKILTGEFGIMGVFKTIEKLEKSTEERMVKINIPAILMPYLRATMTNILSGAGFGTVLFPLINMYELAEKSTVQIIDYTSHSEKKRFEWGHVTLLIIAH
jgi:preprotein translocase subunit SecB